MEFIIATKRSLSMEWVGQVSTNIWVLTMYTASLDKMFSTQYEYLIALCLIRTVSEGGAPEASLSCQACLIMPIHLFLTPMLKSPCSVLIWQKIALPEVSVPKIFFIR